MTDESIRFHAMGIVNGEQPEIHHARWSLRWTAAGTIVGVIALIVTLFTIHGNSTNKSPASGGIANGPSTQNTNPNSSVATPTSQPTDDTVPTSEPTGGASPLPPAPSPQHVSLFLLCVGSNSSDACEQGAHAVGDQVFSYDILAPVNVNPGTLGEWESVVAVPANTCSELVIQFTPSRGLTGNTSVSVRVLQEGPASATVSAATDHIATLKAKLNGSPFYLEFKSTVAKGPSVWFSGYGVCTTDSGLPE